MRVCKEAYEGVLDLNRRVGAIVDHGLVKVLGDKVETS